MEAGAVVLHFQPGGMAEAGLKELEAFGDAQGGGALQR